jgi:NAD(P)-dependent dehydrogenase (short-subunit alcohol dehydrogenase family)
MDSKILIVTGASRGIGASTARLAARRGYSICVNYLQNKTAAESVVREIKDIGGKAVAI